MKRLLYLLLVCGLFAACEKSEIVAPAQPLKASLADVIRIAQEGAAMLNDATSRTIITRRIDLNRINCRVKPATRANSATDTLYYVVNYADDAGFAIVSANENASDGARLIAVAESGYYTAGEETPNKGFNIYMEMVENSIATRGFEIDTNTMLPPISPAPRYHTERIYTPWEGIDPLVTVKWGQGNVPSYNANFPYNQYCFNPDGLLCPAGCVAVAIAQIMSYHQKPASYQLTYELPHRTIPLDWNAINSYIGGYDYTWTSAASNTIALWFREIGHRCNMDYTPNGSGATNQWAREAFASFGYDQFGSTVYNYSKIKSELSAYRPLYISGSRIITNSDGTTQYSGHAWVADGYKSRTCQIYVYEIMPSATADGLDKWTLLSQRTEEYRYVHYNWGYDGMCNGFFSDGVFRTNNANTEAGGYDNTAGNYIDRDYQYDVHMITDIINQHTY